MPKPYDPILKVLGETEPADWLTIVGCSRAPTTILNADLSTVAGAADLVMQVHTRPESLFHLEFQSGHDGAEVPPRLHLANTVLTNRHNLPVRSVVILLRREADAPVLTGLHVRQLPGEKEPYLTFRYQAVRVWLLNTETLLAGGVGTLPLAPVSNVTLEQLPGVIGQMKERLGLHRSRQAAKDLWAATFVLLGLRYSADLAAELLQGVITMKESTTYQAILAEGGAEGRARGGAEEARKILLLQGKTRFETDPSAEQKAILNAIADLNQLETLSVRLVTADSWEQLLPMAAPRSRRTKKKGGS